MEKETTSQWQAWWSDQPEEAFDSPGLFGAVVKRLRNTEERGVSGDDLQLDFHASHANRMEFFGKPD